MDERDRRSKKQWLARQKAASRSDLPLSDPELALLFDRVDQRIAESGCDHSLRFTSLWLQERGHDPEKVVAWLRERGGYCDCEVVANARDDWERNRR